MSKYEDSSTIEIDVEIIDDFVPEEDGVSSYLGVKVYRVNGETREKIGEIRSYVYDDVYANLIELADMHSEDHLDLMRSVSFNRRKGAKKVYVCGEIVIIDHVYINPEHQGKGYGTKAMEQFLTFLSDVIYKDYALLMAHPLPECLPNNRDDELNEKQLKENKSFIKEKKKQLSRFYQQFGFVHTGNAKENCMVKNLQE